MKQISVKQWIDYVYKVYTKRLEVTHKQEVEEEKKRRSNAN